MAGRKYPDRKTIQLYLFIPVGFMDFGKGIAPFFIIASISKARHHMMYFRFYFLHEIIVQMIPVIMGQHHDIQIIGNVLRTVHIAPVKGSVDERERRSVQGRYGVNKYFLSAQLHIEGGMPQPHHHIVPWGNGFQVFFLMNHGILRNIHAGGGEQERLPKGYVRCHFFMGHLRMEFTVPVMR